MHQWCAIIKTGLDAIQASVTCLVQNKNLSLGATLFTGDCFLTIQFEIIGGFFHKAINLGAGHIVFICDSDKNSLSAASLRQKQFAGC